ncbi:hypothetical protein B0T16DRAFT_227525 [Cercophora newfieldiana]|uniref:Zn(2)-C6 fungal-type domain-containing protein n=1 Tax=Cercophora newfieldiana TaxID=92897 RepID=A0AA40CH33_9PEZI|nr:hypothetical protein B0T16DRAFT_227525 [Cercophora newfieldiana]
MPASDSTESARSPPAGRATFGCENCREQHLGCDRVTPTCGRCRTARRECRRTTLKIRTAQKSFNKKQKWVKIPRILDFHDETRSVIRDATNQDSGAEDVDVDTRLETPGAAPEDHSSRRPLASAEVTPSPSFSRAPGGSPSDRFIQRDQRDHEFILSNHQDPWVVPPSHTSHPTQQTYVASPSTRSLLPLSDPRHAKLFSHFIQHLAGWLDLCDKDKSFEMIISQRARTSEVLMNAILALASMHLANTQGNIGQFEDERYKELADSLHPFLRDQAFDAEIFAATIIMRVWEEINMVKEKEDREGYILTIHRVAEMSDIEPGSLSAASFWVGLRQEIFVAVIKKEVVRMPLVPSLIRSLTGADDFTWANRAVVHCAEVLNYCYDRTNRNGRHRWEVLHDQSEQWKRYRPASYTEIYQQDSEEHAIPEIWYQQGCHVIGMQHHLLAALYLERYDPRDRDDLTRSEMETLKRAQIQSLVRQICGIGLGNQRIPPSMFTACMAIAAFEDYFDSPRDRAAMMDILEMTERNHARPTESVRRKMLERGRRVKTHLPFMASHYNSGI